MEESDEDGDIGGDNASKDEGEIAEGKEVGGNKTGFIFL